MLKIRIPKSARLHVWYLTTIAILALWVAFAVRANSTLHEEIAQRDRTLVVTVRILENRLNSLKDRIDVLQQERDKLLDLWKRMRKDPNEPKALDDGAEE